MWLYLLIFAVPFVFYCAGEAENRNKFFLICYTAFLAVFVGISDMFGGYDRYIYAELFDSMANDITNDVHYSQMFAFGFHEIGYSFIAWLIAHITENRYIYILIITLLVYFNIYKTFERHVKNYPLAFMLFFGIFFFFTFTYLRQVLAVSLAWMSIRYLLDRKRVLFFAMMIAVALIHKSGIVFAVMYFIPIRKYSKVFVLLVLGVCALLGVSGVTSTLYDVYLENQAELDFMGANIEYQAGYSQMQDTRIAYLIEVLFFVGLILLNYDKIKPTRENMIFLNMAWCFCAVLLLFVKSDNGGRMAWLFTIGIIHTLSIIASPPKLHSKAMTATAGLLIFVSLALYLRIYRGWQTYNNLYPYKTFFSNGYRQPDYSWEIYEYDHRYDEDKFYRPAFRFLKK